MFWYSEDGGNLYSTSSNKSLSGSKKAQNRNKTFTAIPTIYHNLETDSIKFAPIISIFEAAKSKFSDQCRKELRSVKLKPGLDRKRECYKDVSTNAWQHESNMKASSKVLQLNLNGVMSFDNWRNFHLIPFLDSLIDYDIYPVYNVKNASGLTGLLDLYSC